MVGVIESPAVVPLEGVEAAMEPVVVASASGPKSGRVKRLERPDQKELDEKIAEHAQEESACFKRIDEIKALIDSKTPNRQDGAAAQAARDRVNQTLMQLRTALEEKRSIREELQMADAARDSARQEAKALKEKLPFVKVEQIDEEIKRLEYRMTHTTLALPEEKKILAQVRELAKSRDFVAKYTERIQKLTNDESARTEISSRLKLKEVVISDLEKQVDAAKRDLNAIKESKATQGADRQALFDEKQRNHERINEIRASIKELRAEFKGRLDEYYEREREWRAQQQVERKRQYELREAERQERDRRRKEWEKENFVEPLTDEILQCEQLIVFLQKAAPAEVGTANTTASKADLVAPEGSAILVSKKNRKEEDLDGWFGGLAQGKKGKKGKAPASEKKAKADKLILPLDAISSFAKVKVPAPTTKDEVTKAIDILKEKKIEFLELQKSAREKREAAEREEAAPKVDVAEASPAPAEAESAEEDAVIVDSAAVVAETTPSNEEDDAEEVLVEDPSDEIAAEEAEAEKAAE